MSRDACTTCGASVRDFDTQAPGSIATLPAHGCANPAGSMPWNDGRHVYVAEYDYRQLGDGDNHDPGDEDRS